MRMFRTGQLNIWIVGKQNEISFITSYFTFTAEISTELIFMQLL
ncbi:Uncharacterised protein [Legionella busanensis]|uniref:Uncharacterized protein n=1 Tax=Legionella busanensis TaxID=190655 RepID=A0A378JQB6_9GAMM|nr:Uncharacterised protein [Legionella busanensis]